MRDTTVFAVDGRPPEQNRPRANAEGPRRARGGHRHGRALGAFMITRGASTPRPGRTDRSRRAYQPLAPGVPTRVHDRTPRLHTPRTLPHRRRSRTPPPGAPLAPSRPRPGQAPGWRRKEARLSLRVPAARRGRTHQTQRPYLHRAMGTVAVRAGRTHPAPWAYSACALGVLSLRAGRTHPAPCTYSLRALDVLAALEKVHAACPHRANTAPSRPARSAR